MKKSKNSPKSTPKSDNTASLSSGPPFAIRMGVPDMDQLWRNLDAKAKAGTLSKNDERLYNKWGKALKFLRENPFYPGLKSHEISSLTQKYGKKIFESYLENNTPGAARMFWTYGPGRAEITILALEPHPEPGAYGRVKLDQEPSEEKVGASARSD